MASDKQNDAKLSPMDENKENSSDGGLGLESILRTTGHAAAILVLLQFYRFQALKLTVAR